MHARELVERVLAVPDSPNTVGRVVLVNEGSEVALRWANNTMTTNGHSTSVRWTVISLVRLPGGSNGGGSNGGGGRTGTGIGAGVVSSSALVTDPSVITDAVRASEAAAVSSGPARDAAPLPEPGSVNGTGNEEGWDDPSGETSIAVFEPFAGRLADVFSRARAEQRTLYGFAHHQVHTIWLGTSTGVRLRWTQPTGSVELNAKGSGSSAWGGRSTATPQDFAALDIAGLDAELAGRLAWGRRKLELPAGRYPTILPSSAVADLMTYMCWEMAGRPAQEGRSAFSAPPDAGQPTRVGERLTDLPLTLTSDPAGSAEHPGLACTPFLATAHSGDEVSVFDNGAGLRRVDWVARGVLGALAYPRAAAKEFKEKFTAPADNLMLTAGSDAPLDELVKNTERGLLLTCLWYIRMVDPASLLLTGLTRDGVYLVEHGEVVGEVNNFRFNESPLDLLRRVTAVGVAEHTLPREFKDWFTRTIMPAVVVPDFNMSSVSQAS
ncbi:MAG: metallopeptidase TldD-related protein [Pseudonocardia sp.]